MINEQISKVIILGILSLPKKKIAFRQKKLLTEMLTLVKYTTKL